ncbi:MAG: hypothetical protein ACOX9E_10605 [Lentisphaeria bacterium]|jgi:hypothetical protein
MRRLFPSLPTLALLAALLCSCECLCADESWPPQNWLLNCLVKAVPGILAGFDHDSGRFNAAQWSSQEQHVLFPLAAAWAYEDPKNPFYHDSQLLLVIGKGGDALCAAQDEKGRLPYRRPASSQSQLGYLPWTFSRWARCFLLVKDHLPPEQRERWRQGLMTAFNEIHPLSQGQDGPHHAHLAVALFIAGHALDQPAWQSSAQQAMTRLVERQSSDGCWLGNWGPALNHNNSLLEALGLYYAVAQDPIVLAALERGALFRLAVTWPDGTAVSAIDDRQPYQQIKNIGNVGFSWTAPGRLFLQRQLRSLVEAKQSVDADYAAAMLIFGGKGVVSDQGSAPTNSAFRSRDGLICIQHQAPWRVCLSAYTAPPAKQRWLLDRHNMLDIYHDALGLIAGGGNGKDQPLWSSFVFTPLSDDEDKADDAPVKPPLGIPTAAKIMDSPTGPLLQLNYGKTQCRIAATPQTDGDLQLSFAVNNMPQPVQGEAHIPFLRRRGPLQLANGSIIRLGDDAINISGKDAGGFFVWGGLQVSFPTAATLHWPVFKQATSGTARASAKLAHARLVMSVPIDRQNPAVTLSLRQVPKNIPGLISHPAKSLSLFSPSATPAKYIKELDAIFLSANNPGESMTLTVPNKKAGRYELYVEFVMNPNYGIAHVTGEGMQAEKSFDCYAPEYDSSGLVPCGELLLTATDFVLTIRSADRNPRAGGSFLAVKSVHLRPAATTATASTTQNHTAGKP